MSDNQMLMIAVLAIIAIVIYIFFRIDHFEPRNKEENPDYIAGPYYLVYGEDAYARYNEYKKDPSQQPINAPPVDYKNNPVSTLPKENKMYADPDPDDIYINLLNGNGRL